MPTSTTTTPTLNQFNIHSNIFYSNLTNEGKHSGFGLINLIIHLGQMPLLRSRFVLKHVLAIKSYFCFRKTQKVPVIKNKYSSKSSLGKPESLQYIFYYQNVVCYCWRSLIFSHKGLTSELHLKCIVKCGENVISDHRHQHANADSLKQC